MTNTLTAKRPLFQTPEEKREARARTLTEKNGIQSAEIEKLRKERDAAIEALRAAREALAECADGLKNELDYRHGSPPSMQSSYQYDIVPVLYALEAIDTIDMVLKQGDRDE